jgi:hypothetical protein
MPGPFPINTTIPAAANDPADDQPQMLTNNSNINQWIKIDHEDPSTNLAGYHKPVHMVNATPPGIGTADGVYFVQAGNPWFQNATGSFPLAGSESDSGDGYATLPGGAILKWGSVGGSSNSNVNVTFTPAFPTAAFTAYAIPIRASSSPGSDFSTVIVTGSLSTTGFTIGNIGAHTCQGWYWMAVGN